MGVSFNGKAESSCQPKISEFDGLAILTNEQILWFEVPVKNPIAVQEDKRLQNLVEEALSLLGRQSSSFLLHVLFQIVLKVFKDEIKLLLAEENFFQPIKIRKI